MAKRSNGEGSIGRRKDGVYYAAVMINGTRKWCYGKTRKEVAYKMKALQQQIAEGVKPTVETVEGFLTRWLDEIIARKLKHSTYQTYKQTVERYIIPALGKIPLHVLQVDNVQALINKLVSKGKAPNTIRNVRSVLRKALNQAIRWRYITFNAAAMAEIPKITQRKITPLTIPEAKAFIAMIKGHRLEVLYLLALYLGLREGELLALQLSSIDSEKVVINGSMIRCDGKWIRVEPKTKSSIRTLPLPPSIIPLLTAYITQQKQQHPNGEYLFTTKDGAPISRYTLLNQFQGLIKKAGITRKLRFHDLRHSCATFLLLQGENVRTVMDVLGHAHISTTMDIYAHILDDTRQSAVVGIDTLLSG